MNDLMKEIECLLDLWSKKKGIQQQLTHKIRLIKKNVYKQAGQKPSLEQLTEVESKY